MLNFGNPNIIINICLCLSYTHASYLPAPSTPIILLSDLMIKL